MRASRARRADAVGLLAERALAAGLGRATDGGGADALDGDGDAANGDAAAADEAAEADAAADAADAVEVPISGTRAERYQVVLYVEPETLAEDGEPGISELERRHTRFS